MGEQRSQHGQSIQVDEFPLARSQLIPVPLEIGQDIPEIQDHHDNHGKIEESSEFLFGRLGAEEGGVGLSGWCVRQGAAVHPDLFSEFLGEEFD